MKRVTGLHLVLPLLLAFASPALGADIPDSLVIIAGANLKTAGNSTIHVTLLGSPFDERRLYMTALYLMVDGAGPVMLPRDSGNGYEPRLIPGDVTGDGGEELLVTASTGGSGGIQNGIICRFGVDGGVSVIFDSGQGVLTPVTGRFLDGYHARIGVNDTTVTLDLTARKEYYDQLKVYAADGRPTGSWEPWSDPYGLFALDDTNGDGVLELAGWQSVSGGPHVDRIALIKSLLSWTGTGWRVSGIAIAPVGNARIE